MRFINILAFFTLLLLAMPSCQNEGNETQASYDDDQLIGRWEISNAWRNGKKTETLSGTYYVFEEDGAMETNLTPSATPKRYTYEFDGQKIHQSGSPEIIYQVESLSDSSLTISMHINKFPFRLELSRAMIQKDSVITEEGFFE